MRCQDLFGPFQCEKEEHGPEVAHRFDGRDIGVEAEAPRGNQPTKESLRFAEYVMNHYSRSENDVTCLAREFDKRFRLEANSAPIEQEAREISYEDWCRLDQVFYANSEQRRHVMPNGPNDARIHEWLKRKLMQAYMHSQTKEK